MGKFCTKCGKPLAEGELCTCQMGRAPMPQNPQGAQNVYARQQNPQGMPVGSQNQVRQQTPNAAQQQYRQQTPNGSAQNQMRQQTPNAAQQQYRQQMPNGSAQNQMRQQMSNAAQAQVQQQTPSSSPASNMQGASMNQQYDSQQQYAYQQQVQQQYQQVQQAASGHMSKIIGTFINIVKNPIVTGKNMIAFADMGVIVSLIVLQAIFAGFFDIAVMAKISSLGMGYLKMPIARSFFVTAIFSCLLSFILAGLLLGGNFILKNVVTYKQMLACVAVRSVLLVLTSLVSIFVFLLIPSAGLFFFYTGSLWGMIAIALIMPKNIDGKEDKMALMQFLSAIVFLICFIIFAQLCWKAYLPDAVGSMMDGLDSLLQDPSTILQNLF